MNARLIFYNVERDPKNEQRNDYLSIDYWRNDILSHLDEIPELKLFMETETNPDEREHTLNSFINGQLNKAITTNEIFLSIKKLSDDEKNNLFFYDFTNPDETSGFYIDKTIFDNAENINDLTKEFINILYEKTKYLDTLKKIFYPETPRQQKYKKEKAKKNQTNKELIKEREKEPFLYIMRAGGYMFNFVTLLNLTACNLDNAPKFRRFINSNGRTEENYIIDFNGNQNSAIFQYRKNKKIYSLGYYDTTANSLNATQEERNASKQKLVKVFVYVMTKFRQIATYGSGEQYDELLKNKSFTITTQELIKKGIFDDIIIARREMNLIRDIITRLFISMKTKTETTANIPLFTKTEFKEDDPDTFIFVVNDMEILWKTANSIMKVPRQIYSLSNNAFMIEYNLSNYARMNSERAEEKEFLSLSIREIINFLGLPDPDETKQIKRDIINPIIKAIEEIKEKNGNDLIINYETVKPSKFIDTNITYKIKNQKILDFNKGINDLKLIQNKEDEKNKR